MIKLRSLSRRLQITFSLLSVVICLFFIRLSVLLVEQANDNAYRQILSTYAQSISDTSDILGVEPFEAQGVVKVYLSSDELPEDIKTYLLSQVNVDNTMIKVSSFFVLSKEYQSNKRVWLVLDRRKLTEYGALPSYINLFLYSVSFGVVILALLSSWYLARLLSFPVRQLTEDVLRQNNDEDITLYGTSRRDEIGTLAQAFQKSFSDIQQVLTREQNFTRDVSHELRTPITLIKNTLALNENKPIENEATQVIKQASQELQQTVEVLLALARQENLTFDKCLIRPIVENAVLTIYNSFPQLVFNVRIDTQGDLKVYGNAYLISLLCQNLVNNGFYHGGDSGMKIYSKGEQIIFENNTEMVKNRPYYQGLGHGQYLVKRIVEEMNWCVYMEQTPTKYRVILQPILC